MLSLLEAAKDISLILATYKDDIRKDGIRARVREDGNPREFAATIKTNAKASSRI